MFFGRLRRFCALLLCLSIPIGFFACSAAQQDQEDLQQESELDQEDQQGENVSNKLEESDEFNGENNNFAGNQNIDLQENLDGGNLEGGGEPLSDGNLVENDLQQIIQEINNSPVDGFAQNPSVQDPYAFAQQPVQNGSAAAFEAPGQMVATAGGLVPEMGAKMPYVVQAGDNLGKIAQKVYGNMGKWREIATLTDLANPSRIYPGDVVYYQLTQESLAFAQFYEALPRGEVTVQPGDTLASISKQVYGSHRHWKSIWRQNDSISNPDFLKVGQVVYFINQNFATAAVNKIDTNTNTAVVKNHVAESNVKLSDATISASLTKAEIPSDFEGFGLSEADLGNLASDYVDSATAEIELVKTDKVKVRAFI